MHEHIVKWLKYLFYVQAASVALSVISMIPGVDIPWITRIFNAGLILCLVMLKDANLRYRTAGIFRAVSLAVSLFASFAGSNLLAPVVALTGSVLSVLALYQEYTAHSELTAPLDGRLSEKWRALFTWQFVFVFFVAVLSSFATVILVLLNIDAELVSVITVIGLNILSLALEALYLLYLQKTLGLLESGE